MLAVVTHSRGSNRRRAYVVAPSTYDMLDPRDRSTCDSRGDACRSNRDRHDDPDRGPDHGLVQHTCKKE